MDNQQVPSSQLLSAAVGAGLSGTPKPPPSPFESYRWYRCEPLDTSYHTTCIQLKSPDDVHILGNNSKLVPVASWIPSNFDRTVLGYTLWLDHKITVKQD